MLSSLQLGRPSGLRLKSSKDSFTHVLEPGLEWLESEDGGLELLCSYFSVWPGFPTAWLPQGLAVSGTKSRVLGKKIEAALPVFNSKFVGFFVFVFNN